MIIFSNFPDFSLDRTGCLLPLIKEKKHMISFLDRHECLISILVRKMSTSEKCQENLRIFLSLIGQQGAFWHKIPISGNGLSKLKHI